MPIWPVSIVDGGAQVADADGALYPITMSGNPVTGFNPGWSARGLQTGLQPFHVLELQHADGHHAFWMLDSALDFRGNAVVHLAAADRELYFAHVNVLVRNLYDDAVAASHAAVPAAAHEFDDFLPSSVRDLISEAIDLTVGRPTLVSLASMSGVATSYTHDGITLQTSWVERVLQTPVTAGIARLSVPQTLSVPAQHDGPALMSQETLELDGHTGFRFLDRATGLVFYVLVGADDADRHLYAPALKAAFTAGAVEAAHDPLLLLMAYYATHAGRVAMLPDVDTIEPGLVHPVAPPQAGLDEPAEIPPAPEPIRMPDPPPPPPPEPVPPPRAAEATAGYRVMPALDAAPVADASARTESSAPRQNWWQRLLGLGNA